MCFSRDNTIILATNEIIPIFNLKIGDSVKSIDNNGRIVDSEIVAILHINNLTESRFTCSYYQLQIIRPNPNKHTYSSIYKN